MLSVQARTTSGRGWLAFSLLAALLLLGFAVAFYSQASALDYATLFRALLLWGCIPQALVAALLWAVADRAYIFAGLVTLAISWAFVAELGLRVHAV